MDSNSDLLLEIKASLLGIATLATNKKSKSISLYLIARSLQKESLKSVANVANNLISMNYPKGF